jgi:MFS transporter, FHS family, L-fucose permease
MTTSVSARKGYVLSITIIGVLFFVFGFVTWLNGTLMPFLQTACELTPFAASIVLFAFYIAYFVMALPSSFVLKRIGYKNGLFWGLIIMAIGALMFIPAAYYRVYAIFLTGLFVLASGLALLQTAVNPFITIIGPQESAAARISFMGICNKMAGIFSPLVLTALIMHGMEKFKAENLKVLSDDQKNILLNELASRIIWPYVCLAIFLILLGVLIKLSSLPSKVEVEQDDESSLKNFIRQIPAALKIKHLLLGVIAIFVYVGVEVIAADSLTQFGKDLNLDYATKLTAFTMAFMVLGYIIGILSIPKIISQSKALLTSTILCVIFSICAIFSSSNDNSYFDFILGWVNPLLGINIPILRNSVFFVSLLGLSNAVMWPAIWPLALNGVGKYTKIASALLIMAIIGGALIPPTYTKLGQSIGFQNALWIMIPCYLFLMYYAAFGHKNRKQDSEITLPAK